jgi:thiol-disulfide isomerase/thioredoxin
MNKFFGFIILAVALLATSAVVGSAQDGHEYAPLQEKTVNYKAWTLKSLKDEKAVDLRSLAQGKRLLMVVYFAPWCPNWRNEAPVATKLYEKYKTQGLEVVGVSEYGSRDDVRAYFGPSGPPFTIVSESESRDERDKTAHYGYRQSTGDTRRWGSPWNIFLEPARLPKTGDVLAERAWIVNGELIEADVEKFIREHLGLDAKAHSSSSSSIAPTKSKTITPCQQ